MSDQVQASAKHSAAVTPSDTTKLEFKALYVGGGGSVAIRHDFNGSTVTYSNVPAGSILPVASNGPNGQVMAATTATSIVAMNW